MPGFSMTRKKPSHNGRKTSPEVVEAKVRAAQALKLRMEGKTFEAIAEELGYAGKQGAYDAVRRSLAEITREPAEELIRLDLERLDAMWGVHYLNAQGGDVQALAACLKLMERRARLLGLDAPEKNALGGLEGAPPVAVSVSPEQYRAIAEAVAAKT